MLGGGKLSLEEDAYFDFLPLDTSWLALHSSGINSIETSISLFDTRVVCSEVTLPCPYNLLLCHPQAHDYGTIVSCDDTFSPLAFHQCFAASPSHLYILDGESKFPQDTAQRYDVTIEIDTARRGAIARTHTLMDSLALFLNRNGLPLIDTPTFSRRAGLRSFRLIVGEVLQRKRCLSLLDEFNSEFADGIRVQIAAVQSKSHLPNILRLNPMLSRQFLLPQEVIYVNANDLGSFYCTGTHLTSIRSTNLLLEKIVYFKSYSILYVRDNSEISKL